MIKKRKYTRQGVTFTTIETDTSVEAALTNGGRKFVLKGIPAIQIMKNSYKYDNQIQITVYNKIGSTKELPRVQYATHYDRIEIFLDKKIFDQLLNEYINEIYELDDLSNTGATENKETGGGTASV